MKNKIDREILFLSVVLVFLSSFALLVITPQIKGDSVTYVEAINFMQSGEFPEDFIPYRIITTFGGLWTVITFSKLLGSIFQVWISMNHIFFAISIFVFYYLVLMIFNDRKIALICSLFLSCNYAILTFGLHYLMDMGGWMFYIISLFFLFKYTKKEGNKYLLLSSLMVGVGGLFKEYALLGVVPIATILIYENSRSLLLLIKSSYKPAIIASVPIITLYIYVYFRFGYTYADWVVDSYKYKYSSSLILRVAEYIKAFGSLYNLLAIFVILGFWNFWKNREMVDKKIKVFLFGAVLSVLPVFVWGGITQRILFITVPVLIIFAGFFFKSNPKYLNVSYVALVVYLILNIIMDSYLLPKINLPF